MMTLTRDRLRTLRLTAMADAYEAQHQDAAIATLAFDERFSMLVDAEALHRDTRALTRRLKEAKLRLPQACLEDLDYAPRRSLDRAVIRQLALGRWIVEHHNLLITGATGVGKTFLACALGQQACRQGHRVIYRRLPRLFPELALAHADGSSATLLARFARVDVLILDDWGLGTLTDRQLVAALTVFVFLFPLWFFRYARSLWIAFDELWDPTKEASGGTPGAPSDGRG